MPRRLARMTALASGRLRPVFGRRSRYDRPRTAGKSPRYMGWRVVPGQGACSSTMSLGRPRRPQAPGNPCKRPFVCGILNCISWCLGHENGAVARREPVAFRFRLEIPDQSRPVLPFRPLLLRKKAALLWKIGAARKAAIHDASNSPGSGGMRRAGRALRVPPGASWPAWLL